MMLRFSILQFVEEFFFIIIIFLFQEG